MSEKTILSGAEIAELGESTQTDLASGASGPEKEAPPAAQKILRTLAWSFLGLLFLTVFTFLKLPEDRVRNYVLGTLNSQLAGKGIAVNADESRIVVGWGLGYVLSGVTLSLPPPDAPIKIEKIEIAPSLLGLLGGKIGGNLWIKNGDGRLESSFAVKKTQMSLSFDSKNLDIGKLGALPVAAGIKGSAVLNGSGAIEGDTAALSTFTGKIDLSLSKIVIDAQSISGFSIPRLAVSEGKIALDADKGKAIIKTFQLGKAGNAADDVQATLTGDVSLGRTPESSMMNIKAVFRLSQTVLKSFTLADLLLQPGKQPDGSYAYFLKGPLIAPLPTPAGSSAP